MIDTSRRLSPDPPSCCSAFSCLPRFANPLSSLFEYAVTEREVVITGLGIVSPIGIGRDAVWESVAAHRSGVRMQPDLEAAGWMAPFAGAITDFDPKAADPAAQEHQGHVARYSARVGGGRTGVAGRGSPKRRSIRSDSALSARPA